MLGKEKPTSERLSRLRKAVGAEEPKKPSAGVIGTGSLEELAERMRLRQLREYEFLEAGGNNADGLEQWRKVMRRIGRRR